MNQHHSKKWEDILSFSTLFLLVVLVNVNMDFFRLRLDLTEEKRYTISPATRQLLEDLDDLVYVEVYLDGELNAGFRRLQQAIRETLEEFRIYGGARVEFKFTDPNEAPNPTARNRFYRQLMEKGLSPTNLVDNVDGKREQKTIFPGAIISYRNREQAVLLLKGNKTASPQDQLNQSVEGVEYELASAIQKLTQSERKRIAFVQGHDELTNRDLTDITNTLADLYEVDMVNLQTVPQLTDYQALIVAQPKKPFTEQEKYRLDQYIMRGGKALFLMDAIQMNLDSIAIGGTYAFGYDLNIEDLLFRYGVRVNQDLIQDTRAGSIEVVTGNFGDRPNVNLLPWPYYVFLNTFGKHPIVRNMDVVYGRFLSTLDTVKAEGVTKTPLIFTSQYSKIKPAPTMVDLNELREDLRPESYNKSFLPVAYLLEGQFTSLFANRFPPRGIQDNDKQKQSVPTRIVVISDGDILRNELDQKGQPIPLDFDPKSRQSLSNRELILNILAYLTDADGLISTRAKEVTLRPLDTFRIAEEKAFWQSLNVAVPVVLVVLFGMGRFYLRKRKYGKAGN